MILLATPAYGQDYSSQALARLAWSSGQVLHSPQVGYLTVADLPALRVEGFRWLSLRHANLQQITVIHIGGASAPSQGA